MGWFSKSIDMGRNGEHERITCQTCGDTYRFNVDRNFPYAICGRCLERESDKARSNGDNATYQQIQNELQRRSRNY